MSKYRLITYDVWGNEKDGYEVNQAFTTNEYYELGEELNKEGIVRSLRKQGCITKQVWAKHIEISGDDETLYIEYKGRPEFELRKVEETSKGA